MGSTLEPLSISEALRAHLSAPPPGSAAARAKEFGIDVFSVVRKLASTTPEQRLTRLDERIDDLRILRAIAEMSRLRDAD